MNELNLEQELSQSARLGETMKLFIIISGLFFILLACHDNSKMPVSDSYDLLDTANVTIEWDSSSYLMTSSRAWLSENQIDVSLFNKNPGDELDLQLQNQAGHWNILESITQPTTTDCLYVSSQFRILNQNINLNKTRFKIGDKLQGSLTLIMLGKKGMFREPLVPFIDNRKWDTISMNGVFSTTIH